MAQQVETGLSLLEYVKHLQRPAALETVPAAAAVVGLHMVRAATAGIKAEAAAGAGMVVQGTAAAAAGFIEAGTEQLQPAVAVAGHLRLVPRRVAPTAAAVVAPTVAWGLVTLQHHPTLAALQRVAAAAKLDSWQSPIAN